MQAIAVALVRFEKFLGRIELIVIIVAMAVMLFAVSSNVLTRAIPSLFPNMNDLALMAMAVGAFVGAAYSSYSLNHICIELLPASANRNVNVLCQVVTIVSVFLFSIVFAYLSWSFFDISLLFGEKTSELGLPIAIPAGAALFGFTAMAFHTLMEAGRFLSYIPARFVQAEGAFS